MYWRIVPVKRVAFKFNHTRGLNCALIGEAEEVAARFCWCCSFLCLFSTALHTNPVVSTTAGKLSIGWKKTLLAGKMERMMLCKTIIHLLFPWQPWEEGRGSVGIDIQKLMKLQCWKIPFFPFISDALHKRSAQTWWAGKHTCLLLARWCVIYRVCSSFVNLQCNSSRLMESSQS